MFWVENSGLGSFRVGVLVLMASVLGLGRAFDLASALSLGKALNFDEQLRTRIARTGLFDPRHRSRSGAPHQEPHCPEPNVACFGH